jgi:hypothetical protein
MPANCLRCSFLSLIPSTKHVGHVFSMEEIHGCAKNSMGILGGVGGNTPLCTTGGSWRIFLELVFAYKTSFRARWLQKSAGNVSFSFKHLKILNSASKCLKIPLKVIKFSKPENVFPKNSS